MEPLKSTPPFSPLAPIAAAIGLTIVGVLHVAGNHTFEGHYDAPVEYVNDAALVLALFGIGLSAWLIQHRQNGRGKTAARAVAIGDGLLIVGILAGMASGEDPSWFLAFGVPGQLLNLVGLIALAVSSWRVGQFARWSLALIAVTVPLGIIGSEAGLSVIPAVGWLGVAWALSRPASVVPAAPATA